MGGRSSRNKGKVGERAVCRLFAAHEPEYLWERAWQVRGGEGRSDVLGVHVRTGAPYPLHVEVKNQKRPNIYAAMQQAIDDCVDGQIPAAVTKRDRGPWLITMTLEGHFAWNLIQRSGRLESNGQG